MEGLLKAAVGEGEAALLVVQVSYDISSPKTKKREISGLIMVAKKIGCANLLLLTDHDYDNLEQEGYKIAVRPVYDYVLNFNLTSTKAR